MARATPRDRKGVMGKRRGGRVGGVREAWGARGSDGERGAGAGEENKGTKMRFHQNAPKSGRFVFLMKKTRIFVF